MNVRKMMARLNASTVKFDTGRGGIPELTPQDIAASLAYVREQFDRDVFCAVWWPAGVRIDGEGLLRQIRTVTLSEFSTRCRAAEIAKLDLHIATAEWEARNNHSRNDHWLMSKLRDAKETADKQRWPTEMRMYHLIPYAVLAEVMKGNTCDACGGRGTANDGLKVIDCPKCEGRCTAPAYDRRRAEAVEKDESAYRKTWAPVYEWVYEKVMSAERAAATAIANALRTADPAPCEDEELPPREVA